MIWFYFGPWGLHSNFAHTAWTYLRRKEGRKGTQGRGESRKKGRLNYIVSPIE